MNVCQQRVERLCVVFRSKRRKRPKRLSSDSEAPKRRGVSPSILNESGEEFKFELPDIDDADGDNSKYDSPRTPSTPKPSGDVIQVMELTPQQKKNLKIPPKDPATLKGRRRATLVVTAASLIGQWLGQVEMHVRPK